MATTEDESGIPQDARDWKAPTSEEQETEASPEKRLTPEEEEYLAALKIVERFQPENTDVVHKRIELQEIGRGRLTRSEAKQYANPSRYGGDGDRLQLRWIRVLGNREQAANFTAELLALEEKWEKANFDFDYKGRGAQKDHPDDSIFTPEDNRRMRELNKMLEAAEEKLTMGQEPGKQKA